MYYFHKNFMKILTLCPPVGSWFIDTGVHTKSQGNIVQQGELIVFQLYRASDPTGFLPICDTLPILFPFFNMILSICVHSKLYPSLWLTKLCFVAFQGALH